MRIAIIGATGMIGQHAARAAAAAGHELLITYRNEAALARLDGLRFDRARADLSDRTSLAAALRGADAVINAAAYYPTEPRPWRDEVAAARTQMESFLAAAQTAKVGRIVYLGGAIALPRRTDGQPANGAERYTTEPADKNPYVQVKWAMDEMVLRAAEAGAPAIVGVPSMTFGEFDHGPTTGQIITGIASGKLPRYVRGNRNVVYAGDAGRGLVLAAERGVAGQRYLFTGENTNMDALCLLIAKAAGVPPPKPIPLALAKLVSRMQVLRWRTMGGALPIVSETAIAVMSSGQHLDGSRSAAIGYAPQVRLQEAVERALRWFRAQGMC
jgi:dihydroflavonol-4-reductase